MVRPQSSCPGSSPASFNQPIDDPNLPCIHSALTLHGLPAPHETGHEIRASAHLILFLNWATSAISDNIHAAQTVSPTIDLLAS